MIEEARYSKQEMKAASAKVSEVGTRQGLQLDMIVYAPDGSGLTIHYAGDELGDPARVALRDATDVEILGFEKAEPSVNLDG